MAENLMGGYEVHPEIGEKERVIFESAMKGHVGVDFKPVAVASQGVNGGNYIFICTGTLVVLHPQTKLYAVKIFTKFENGASTLEIQGIDEIDVASLVK